VVGSAARRSQSTSSSPTRRRRRVVGPPNKSTANVDNADDYDYRVDQSATGNRIGQQPRDSGRNSSAAAAAAVHNVSNSTAAVASYKHVANVPLTSFDRFLVDSDADTVTSHDVRERFRAAITSGPKGSLPLSAIKLMYELIVRHWLSSKFGSTNLGDSGRPSLLYSCNNIFYDTTWRRSRWFTRPVCTIVCLLVYRCFKFNYV